MEPVYPKVQYKKIEEVRRMVNKYPQYCPDGLLQWIRTIERRLNGWS